MNWKKHHRTFYAPLLRCLHCHIHTLTYTRIHRHACHLPASATLHCQPCSGVPPTNPHLSRSLHLCMKQACSVALRVCVGVWVACGGCLPLTKVYQIFSIYSNFRFFFCLEFIITANLVLVHKLWSRKFVFNRNKPGSYVSSSDSNAFCYGVFENPNRTSDVHRLRWSSTAMLNTYTW